MVEPTDAAQQCFTSFRETRDPKWLGRLFDELAPELFRLALHLTGEPATAEDVLQETFLAVFGAADRFEAGRPVRPWMAGILRRQAGRARRRAQRDRRPPAPEEKEAAEEPGAAADRAEAREKVHDALRSLEEPYRTPAILRWRYGMTPAEIAEVIDRPPGTVWSLLSRARGKLRKRLTALAGLFFPGFPRGLDHVKRQVLIRAGVASPTLPLLGAFTVVTVKKLAVAVLVLVLLAAGAGLVFRPGDDGNRPSPSAPPAPDVAATAPVPDPDADPEPDPEGGALAGTVVDESGRAVAGARVLLAPPRIGRTLDPDADEEGVVVRLTDAEGRFGAGLSPEEPLYDVAAFASGYAPALLLDRRRGEEARLVLRRGFSLNARVVSSDGSPAAGARVELRGFLGLFRIVREQATGADGVARFGLLPPGQKSASSRWLAVVRAPGRPPLIRLFDPAGRAGDTVEVTFVLPAGSMISGRVVAAGSGEPIAGARVVLKSWSAMGFLPDRAPQPSPWPAIGIGEATTAADGTYRLALAPSGGFESMTGSPGLRLVVRAPGWIRAELLLRRPAPGEEIVRDFELSRGGVITGTVVGPAGRPVGGALVRAGMGEAHTAGNGSFRVEEAPFPAAGDGEVTLRIFAGGTEGWRVPDATVAVPVTAGREARAGTVRLPEPVSTGAAAGPVYRVRVTTPDGRPAWGAEVGVEGIGSYGRTDAEGRFAIRPGNREFPPHPRGFARSRGRGIAFFPLDADGETTVRLEAGARLEGRVCYADGRPAPGVSVDVVLGDVSAADAASDSAGMHFLRPGLPPVLLVRVGSAVADREGRFEVEDLPACPLHVLANAPDPQRPGRIVRAIRGDVAAGAGSVEVVLPAEATPGTASIYGVLTDAATGEPWRAGYAVYVRNDGHPDVPTAAMREFPGRFRLDGLPAGTWNVQIVAPGCVPREESVTLEEGEARRLDVALDRGLSIEGRVELPDGVAASGVVLDFTRTDGPGALRAELDGEGRFRVGAGRAGRWHVTCRSPLLLVAGDAPIVVPPDGLPAPVKLRMVPAGRLGVSTHIDGSTGGRRIEVRDESGETVILVEDRCRGWLRDASILPPGRYHVRLYDGHGLREELNTDLPSNTRVELTLPTSR